MTIKGLSEEPRLPRLGKIRTGVKREAENGQWYPSAVDYFVCPPEIQAFYGETPRELEIVIPVDDDEKWCPQYYKCYSKTRGLICKGDGVKANRLVMVGTEEFPGPNVAADKMGMREVECFGRDCPHYRVKCRMVMNLLFLLPAVPGLGVWQLDTGSINAMLHINNTAALIRAMQGTVAGVRLLLTLEPQQIRLPDLTMKTIYVLHLRSNDTMGRMLADSAEGMGQVLMLHEAEDVPDPEGDSMDLLAPDAQMPDGVQFVEGSPGEFEDIPSASQDPPGPAKEDSSPFDDVLATDNPNPRVWSIFWKETRDMGFDKDAVHAVLQVSSIKEGWCADGKTLRQAIDLMKATTGPGA